MPKYVAFLKAINVGGHVVKMETLKELFADLKFSNIESFIASGNIIFDTKSTPDQKLEQKIEKHLEYALGYPVGTFVRSIEEVHAISIYQPFSEDLVKTSLVLSVAMTRSEVPRDIADQVKQFNSDVDDFHIHGREAYWLCKIRTSDSKFPAKKFEKLFGGGGFHSAPASGGDARFSFGGHPTFGHPVIVRPHSRITTSPGRLTIPSH